MGHSMNGFCPCGYERSVALGASMQEFATVNSFPFICMDCEEFVSLNIKLMPEVQCDRCHSKNVRPLTDPEFSDLRTNLESLDNAPFRSPPFIRLDAYIRETQESYRGMSEEELLLYDMDLSVEKLRESYDIESRAMIRKLETPFWGLHCGPYYCPKCHEISLRFEQGIFFD